METTEAIINLDTVQKTVQSIGERYWKRESRLPRTQIVDHQGKPLSTHGSALDLQLHKLRIVQPYGTRFALARQTGWRGQKSRLMTNEELLAYTDGWLLTLAGHLLALATGRIALTL